MVSECRGDVMATPRKPMSPAQKRIMDRLDLYRLVKVFGGRYFLVHRTQGFTHDANTRCVEGLLQKGYLRLGEKTPSGGTSLEPLEEVAP